MSDLKRVMPPCLCNLDNAVRCKSITIVRSNYTLFLVKTMNLLLDEPVPILMTNAGTKTSERLNSSIIEP